MAIKAIETKYKGYRFRSRLEARWAVAFDDMKLDWEYESEGYALPSGGYLPDFWVPSIGVFLEVKGQSPSEREVQLLMELAAGTGKDVAFLIGQPSARLFSYVRHNSAGWYGGSAVWYGGYGVLGKYSWNTWWCYVASPCEKYGFTDFGKEMDEEEVGEHLRSIAEMCFSQTCEICQAGRVYRDWDRAVIAARSARFEHGERPR